MWFAGVKWNGETHIGVLTDQGLRVLASATDFFADLPRWVDEAKAGGGWTPGEDLAAAAPAWPGARVLCVGLNYKAHAAEGGFTPPEYPAIFGRWARSLVAGGEPVAALDERLDWEGELAVVVGARLADATPQEALAGVLGYAVFNDISARTFQRHTHQWTPGKNMDGSGVMGPIVSADEVGDPADGLRLETRFNGQVMQSATTADMIFPVGDILAYLSKIMTLYPGDIVVTGTPEGVGYARNPPILMRPGDEIEVSIERLGAVRNRIVGRERRAG